jgi:hypothetical protein
MGLLSCPPASLTDYGTWSIRPRAACLPATKRHSHRIAPESAGVFQIAAAITPQCATTEQSAHTMYWELQKLLGGVGRRQASHVARRRRRRQLQRRPELGPGRAVLCRAVPCRFLPTNQALPFPKLQWIEPWSVVEPGSVRFDIGDTACDP